MYKKIRFEKKNKTVFAHVCKGIIISAYLSVSLEGTPGKPWCRGLYPNVYLYVCVRTYTVCESFRSYM